MRIAIIIDSLFRGGSERQAMISARELARRGDEVDLIYYNRLDPMEELEQMCGAQIVHIPKNGTRLRFVRRLYTQFKSRRYDVVHAFKGGESMFAAVAAMWRGSPTMIAGLRAEYDATGLLHIVNRLIDHVVDGWIGNSRASVASLIQAIHCDPRKAHLVYNGIDPEALTSSLSAADAKRRLGLSPESRTVMIMARLEPQKNHPLFFQAASLIVRECPTAHFLIVGEGTLRTELEALARSLEITEHIHFLGMRSDVPDLLATTDVAALSSNYEGLANVLLEAMSVGKPIVSTAYAGVDELLTDGSEGIVTPLGDAPAFAGAILRLFGDETLRSTMGQRGRDSVRRRFSMDALAANLRSAYLTCMDQAGKTPHSIGNAQRV